MFHMVIDDLCSVLGIHKSSADSPGHLCGTHQQKDETKTDKHGGRNRPYQEIIYIRGAIIRGNVNKQNQRRQMLSKTDLVVNCQSSPVIQFWCRVIHLGQKHNHLITNNSEE